MKKFTVIILTVTLFFVIAGNYVFAQQQYTSERYFRVKKYKASLGYEYIVITKYTGKDAVVNIPPTIQGLPVEVIGEEAFADTKNKLTVAPKYPITSVTIPDRVHIIGINAFYGNKLTSVTIPASVNTIKWGAFSNNQLTSITFSNGQLTTIEEYAFTRNQLTKVILPEGTPRFRFSKAFDSGTILTTEKKELANTYLASAKTFLADKDYDNAIANFKKAFELDPDNEEVIREWENMYLEPAKTYMANKDYSNALACYQKAFEIVPKNKLNFQQRLDTYLRTARACLADKDHYNAIKSYQKALEIAPDSFEAKNGYSSIYVQSAKTYLNNKDYDNAIANFKKALEIDSYNREAKMGWANIYLQPAKTYLANKDYTNAITNFQKALEADSNNTEARRGIEQAKKAIWDKRIADNRNKYPVPFEGIWKCVTRTAQFFPEEKRIVNETYYTTEQRSRQVPYRTSSTEYIHDGKGGGRTVSRDSTSYRTEYYTESVPRTRAVEKTVPAYSLPEIYMIYQFNGINYTSTSAEGETVKERKTGTFCYDGNNIELDDGTILKFANGVISDNSQHTFKKQ